MSERKPDLRGAPFRIHLLSDATGNLPRHMVTTLLTQFPEGAFELRVHRFLGGSEGLDEAIEAVTREGHLAFHALVDPQAKKRVERACEEAGVPARDLTGPFVRFLEAQTGIRAEHDLARLHPLDETYHRRIEAVEFTLAHDDGQGTHDLSRADIVLAGVSRTSKTPTSVFLAQQGWRVANVPLTPPVQPPEALLALPRGRVAGLVIDADRLLEIRTQRWSALGSVGRSDYADPEKVERELQWSRRLFRERGWAIIDVTNRAVEETAARVLEHLGHRPAFG